MGESTIDESSFDLLEQRVDGLQALCARIVAESDDRLENAEKTIALLTTGYAEVSTIIEATVSVLQEILTDEQKQQFVSVLQDKQQMMLSIMQNEQQQ